MASIQQKARYAGILYLIMAVMMIFAFMYLPARFIVAGDAAATARNLVEHAQLYRVGILVGVLCQVLFIFVAIALHGLFREVDRTQAGVIVALIGVGVAVEIANFGNRLAPTVLLGGSDFLSAFTRPQLEAASLAFLRLASKLGLAAMIIWGLWLFPFGNLVIKSRHFPRVLGYLLYATGAAYLANFVVGTVAPEYMGTVSKFIFPLYFGELGIVFWMVIKGAGLPAIPAATRGRQETASAS